MKSVHVCPPITLSFGLSYTLMRLRRSVLRRSRRIPERRIVEQLSMFSSYIVFFFFIVFFLLSSYSSSSSPSPSLSLFFTHLQFFFLFLFNVVLCKKNGCFKLVPKQGGLLFVDSSRFQMQIHTSTKDATKGLEGTCTAKRRLRRATFLYFASNLPSRLFRAVECFALSRSSILCSGRIAFAYAIALNKGNFH